jgi:hypothetical protein
MQRLMTMRGRGKWRTINYHIIFQLQEHGYESLCF